MSYPLANEEEQGFFRAAQSFIEDYGVEFLAVEVICWIPALGLAGTIDWIGKVGGRTVIGDWKTRAKRHAAYPEEVAQLGTYSLAEHLVVGKFPGELRPFPEVDALMVASLMSDGSYAVYPIDLEGARQTARHMANAHYGVEDLAVEGTRAIGDPIKGQAPPPPVDEGLKARQLWIQGRVRALPKDAKNTAARLWPRDVPKKAALMNDEQVTAVVACLDTVEKEHSLPFFDRDPAAPPPAPGSAKPRLQPETRKRARRSTTKKAANK